MKRKWTTREKKLMMIGSVLIVITISLLFSTLHEQGQIEQLEWELVYEQEVQSNGSNEHLTGASNAFEEEHSQEDLAVFVDIKGAVQSPGVYQLMQGDRVADALRIAGQITAEGTTEQLNLAQKVTDGMVIYVPTKKEIEEGHINKFLSQQGTSFAPNPVITSSGKVNINQASPEELEKLPGIGSSRAQAIVEYRTKNGAFNKLEDLMNVSGIGSKIFERLKDMIEI